MRAIKPDRQRETIRVANRFMADIDAAFVEQIHDLPQRKRKPDIHPHGQVDDLGGRLEI